MKKEEKLLINICNAFLHKEKVNIDDEIDFKYLFKLAKHHNLLAVCHCALKDSQAPEDFKKALLNSFLDYVYISQCQENALDELNELMEKKHIKYVLFKGAVLRELYPIKECRAMGDIDLLIEPKNRDRVKSILIDNGYVCSAENGPVFDYRKGKVLFEVHTKIINEFGENAFNDAFENAEFTGSKGMLNPNYHMAYLIAHMAHHFKFYGAGIKLIMDLAVMQGAYEINLDEVFSILSKINLDEFGRVALSVCFQWFGIGKDYKKSTDACQEFLVSGGAFGSLKENKGAVIKRRELQEGKENSSLITKLQLAFPSYSKLKDIPYIKFINGRPWLTPYAWCYRFYYNIKNRRDFMVNAVKSIDDEETNALAEKELELFKEIGLL